MARHEIAGSNFAPGREFCSYNAEPMALRRETRLIRGLRAAGLAAGMAAILFVATGASLWHVDAPGSTESTCPICHLAHLPILPSMPVAVQAVRPTLEWLISADRLAPHAEPPSATPPSRAPPQA